MSRENLISMSEKVNQQKQSERERKRQQKFDYIDKLCKRESEEGFYEMKTRVGVGSPVIDNEETRVYMSDMIEYVKKEGLLIVDIDRYLNVTISWKKKVTWREKIHQWWLIRTFSKVN